MGNIWGFPDSVWQHKLRHVQKYTPCIGVLLYNISSVAGLSVRYWRSIPCHSVENISDVVCLLICMHSHRGLSHQTASPGGPSHSWHTETLRHTQIQTSGQFKVSVTLQRPKHDCRISRWKRKSVFVNLSSCFLWSYYILLLIMLPQMLWCSFFCCKTQVDKSMTI